MANSGEIGAEGGQKLLDALSVLEARRAPYDELLSQIVAETLARFPPVADKPIIEIGAGTGQLRTWLPWHLHPRVLHTDPSTAALAVLRERAPDADTAEASAHRLPVGGASRGGALGLCVFDAVHGLRQENAVVNELGRVLVPKAPFIHFLDMATLLEQPFEQLNADGLVPIPNVVGDPSDHDFPLDIVLFQRDWLLGLLNVGLQIKHPLTELFGVYFGAFLAEPFDVKEAVNVFRALGARDELRVALADQLASLCQVALQRGYPPLAAIPYRSGRYLSRVLEESFARSGLFRILSSEVVTRSTWRPREARGGPRYRSLAIGHERIGDQLPRRLLTDSARAAVSAGTAPRDSGLVEVGVFVFVAERC